MAPAVRMRRTAGWSTAQQAVVDRLFVYGTLRSGQAARSLVTNYVSASRAATATGHLYSLDDGCPALVPGPSGTVVGELCHLRDLVAALALLDAYEGQELVRTLLQVSVEGQTVWAWAYLLANPHAVDEAEIIECGDWARHLSGQ